MTHPTEGIPRGDPSRVRQLQNLMHSAGGRDPIMGSRGFYVDPHTSTQLDYGLPSLPEESYAEGGAPVFQGLEHPQSQVSQYLGVQEELANEGLIEEDMPENRKYGFDCDNMAPFVNAAGEVYPNTYPVIRIENIPYGVSYGEIMMFMEKHLMPRKNGTDRNYPIHIFMDRATGKTQDAWLELPDQETHDWVMRQYEAAITARKPHKMANRVVDITSSSQGQLMAAVFPTTKGTYWDLETGIPIMLKLKDVDPYSSAFRGFLSKEELYLVRMHAENPARKVLPRCYESMITTLLKYPWASPYYKVAERDDLFKTYEVMLESLASKVFDKLQIAAEGRTVGLTEKLCTNFVNVGLRCPGFSERQKYRISEIMGEYEIIIEISPFSKLWPCQALGIPPEVNDDDLEKWVDLFDNGALHTDLYPGTYGALVGNLIELGRDSYDVWWMEDLSALATAGGDPKAQGITFADLADAEQLLLTALLSRGWEKFFNDRGVGIGDELKVPQPETPVIKNKMEQLGVYKLGGIDRPKEPKAGDDIVYVAPENIGAWRHLMTCNASEIPVKSLTEVLADIGIEADPEDELDFQRIQAEIRGDLDPSEKGSSAGGVDVPGSETQEAAMQDLNPQFRGRPGYGAMQSESTPNFHARTYSSVASTIVQERTPQGGPRAAVLASRAAGTYSVPQRRPVSMVSPDDRQKIDFGSIARQAIATKSKDNTPTGKVSSTANYDPFGPSPARGRGASPEHAGHIFQAGSSLMRRRSQSPAKFDPFGPSPARAAAGADTPRVGCAQELTPATVRRRSQSPAKIGPFGTSSTGATADTYTPRVGRINEPGPSIARRRSKSPNKGNYALTIKPPAWGGSHQLGNAGPVGTPSRRGTVSNTMDSGSGVASSRGTVSHAPVAAVITPTRRGTVTNTAVAASTLPEGETIEDWPTLAALLDLTVVLVARGAHKA